MFAPASLSLKGRALRALAAREHSRAELARKLASFETEPGELATLLDELCAKGFINEQRVADSLAYRRGAKLGTARVVQELKARGVEASAVLEATAALKATEWERAREVWRKKFGSNAADADRLKQMRFLASRGFAPEVIRRVVGGDADE
ncbi:MAG: recombination regulator RecX [Burkholderiaceae bacterium]